MCGTWLINRQYTPAEAPTICVGSNTDAPIPPAITPAKYTASTGRCPCSVSRGKATIICRIWSQRHNVNNVCVIEMDKLFVVQGKVAVSCHHVVIMIPNYLYTWMITLSIRWTALAWRKVYVTKRHIYFGGKWLEVISRMNHVSLAVSNRGQLTSCCSTGLNIRSW